MAKMARKEVNGASKRNRKARTTSAGQNDTSTSTSSPDDNESSSPVPTDNGQHDEEAAAGSVDSSEASESASNSHESDQTNLEPLARAVDPQQAFDDFYLKQVTKEFANDLDKLRSASDFRGQSVAVLIEALRQGRACFTSDERVRIGTAASQD